MRARHLGDLGRYLSTSPQSGRKKIAPGVSPGAVELRNFRAPKGRQIVDNKSKRPISCRPLKRAYVFWRAGSPGLTLGDTFCRASGARGALLVSDAIITTQ